MKKLILPIAVVIVVVTALITIRIQPVFAHEHRPVGPYEIVFGWDAEPAYAGVYNKVGLTISMHDDPTKMVEGAESSLKIEVGFGGKTKALKLEASDEAPGHYYAAIIPSRAGDYTFHVTGKIGDTAVDETFNSADGKFDGVEPTSDILFPEPEASSGNTADLQAQIDALKAEIEQLKAGK